MLNYLKEATGYKNLEELKWEELVNKIILPGLAYRADQRNRIGSAYMAFMAKFAKEVYNKYLGQIMLELAMQRISDGAVLQEDKTPTFSVLPPEYKTYGSQNGCQGGEPGLMDKECFDFIINALPLCLSIPATKAHALAIAFGLVRYLDEQGNPQDGYMLGCIGYKPDGKLLYTLAKKWVEEKATQDELFRHYAQPSQWRKHLDWFAQANQAGELNWKSFFAATNADGNGNFAKRWLQRKKVKKEIISYGK